MKKIISICFILFLLGPTLIFAEDKLTEEQAQEELLALQAQLAEAEAKIEKPGKYVSMADIRLLRMIGYLKSPVCAKYIMKAQNGQ
jgi:hypothetical protein